MDRALDLSNSLRSTLPARLCPPTTCARDAGTESGASSTVTTSTGHSKYYVGQAFYRPVQRILTWEFVFLITRNDPSVVEEVKVQYEKENWIHHHQQILQFKEYKEKSVMAITLCVSEPILPGDKWELEPVNPVKIEKSEVDHMPEKSKPPYCRLVIKWTGKLKQALPNVSRLVTLEGAKEGKDYFSIQLPERGADSGGDHEKDGRSSLGKRSRGSGKKPSKRLKISSDDNEGDDEPSDEDLLYLVATKVSDYYKLGVTLRLGSTNTERIEKEYGKDVGRINMKILTTWKEKMTKTPITWPTLTEALRKMGLNNVVRDINDELEQRPAQST